MAGEYTSEQDMMFKFLNRIDYTQSWKDIEYGMGYDLGDYFFRDQTYYDKIRLAAMQMWLILHPENRISQIIKENNKK